jgi:hypothetical protein
MKPGVWTGWFRVDNTLPATARLAAAAVSGRVIVYASDGTSIRYRHYVGGWVGYLSAPYTCALCLPADQMSTTIP